MSAKSHIVKLTTQQRHQLQKIVSSGSENARKITRCRILLSADKGKTDAQISESLDVSLGTIYNVRRRYSQAGIKNAICEKFRPGQPAKITGRAMAKITALACSKAPQGHARWSLRLLAGRVVQLNIVESISYQSVRTILKKTNLSLISKNNGASAQ